MSVASTHAPSKVWRACERCRKRKIKCDGKEPCSTCNSKCLPCEFPAANDNAAMTRQYMPVFEAHRQRVDGLCEKVEALLDQLAPLANLAVALPKHSSTSEVPNSIESPLMEHLGLAANTLDDVPMHQPDSSNYLFDSSDDDESTCYTASFSDDDNLAMDSYGKFRYVGGAPNKLLIEAVRAASQPPDYSQNSFLPPASQPTSSKMSEKLTVEPLPFFTPGLVWPKLPYLPSPEDVPRPPKYLADVLVNAFFDQMSDIFPIIYRPRFMQLYHNMMNSDSGPGASPEFLSVFFAVCAFSSSLITQLAGPRFSGMEFYEKAVVLHYASTGRSSIEQVQSLSLLSLCAARWNTSAQSWKFAGQAVRAAQDIGLHVGLCLPEDGLDETAAKEQARRTWWAVATLDCIMSLTLGRPMIGLNSSSTCPLPTGRTDDQLERSGAGIGPSANGRSLGGFIVFGRLCAIISKIGRICRRERRSTQMQSAKRLKLLEAKRRLQQELHEWKQGLSDEIAFEPENLASTSISTGNQTMRAIVAVIYPAAAMHLHGGSPKAFEMESMPDGKEFYDTFEMSIQSAQDCIRAAERLDKHVPPSHYLTACVHQVTLAGLLLLRSAATASCRQEIDDSLGSCITVLSTLEAVWPPAQRNASILKHLLDRKADDSMSDGLLDMLNYSNQLGDPLSATFPSLPMDSPGSGLLGDMMSGQMR